MDQNDHVQAIGEALDALCGEDEIESREIFQKVWAAIVRQVSELRESRKVVQHLRAKHQQLTDRLPMTGCGGTLIPQLDSVWFFEPVQQEIRQTKDMRVNGNKWCCGDTSVPVADAYRNKDDLLKTLAVGRYTYGMRHTRDASVFVCDDVVEDVRTESEKLADGFRSIRAAFKGE